jgi:hypothetical protein
MDTPHKNWVIRRVELVFYDPLRLQWQLYQNSNEPSDVPHRRYIKQLLDSAEDLFESASDRTKFDFKTRSSTGAAPTDVCFEANQLLKQKKVLDLCEKHPRVWEALINKLESIANQLELAKVEGKIIEISELVKEVVKFRDNPQSRPEHVLADVKLTQDAALELLSILPIRSHWDTYGLWSGFHPRYKNALPASSPSYLYATKILYKDPDNSEQSAKSYETLGYEVRIETFKTSLDDNFKFPTGEDEKDFFDYCWHPVGNEEENPKERQGQLPLYQFYAFFNDTIIGQLSTSEGDEDDASEIFIITYPLRTLGRTHFLQVTISANPESGKHGLARLWFDWQKIHQRINWSEAQICFAEDIEQIDLTRFQTLVNGALINTERSSPFRPYASLPPDAYKIAICEYGSLLFSADTFCYNRPPYLNQNGSVRRVTWKYDFDVLEIDDEEYPYITWSNRWQLAPPEFSLAIPDKDKNEKGIEKLNAEDIRVQRVRDKKEMESSIDRLYHGRRAMILQQQLRLSRELNESLKVRRHEERKRKGRETFNHVSKLSYRDKAAVAELLERTADTDQLLKLPVGGRAFGELMSPWCESFGKRGEEDWRKAREVLMRWMKPTITLSTSEYLGIGGIKFITHISGEFFSGTVQELKQDIESRYSKLVGELSNLDSDLEWVKAYKARLQEFSTTVDEKMTKCIRRNATTHTNTIIAAQTDPFESDKLNTLRKAYPLTVGLSWRHPSGSTGGCPKIETSVEYPTLDGISATSIQLHLPVNEALAKTFASFCNLVEGTTGWDQFYSFAVRGNEYHSDKVKGAYLYKNYLTVQCNWSRSDIESVTNAHLLIDARNEQLSKFGYLYVVMPGSTDSGATIYDLTSSAEDRENSPLPVSLREVFPHCPEEAIRGSVLKNFGEGKICFIWVFESWRE